VLLRGSAGPRGRQGVATDIDDARGRADCENRAFGGEAKYFHHDVTSEAAWAEVVAATEKLHGRLDILVSNAGIALSAPSIVDVSLSDSGDGRQRSIWTAYSCR
jgi:NAD(P)-dependent dehydrogenase (short-subunit alcohol dehydrogenase family)